MGEHQARDEIGTVAGRDHCDIQAKAFQDVWQAHCCHDQTQGFPIHPRFAAQHELGVRSLQQRSECRRGEQGAFCDSCRDNIWEIGKRLTNRISGVMINPG